jgi:lipoyl(octanoyl) transferase
LYIFAKKRLVQVHHKNLGIMRYKEAWDYQEEIMQANLAVKAAQRTAEIENQEYTGVDTTSHFLFVEHPAVFTLGKSGLPEHMLFSKEHLESQGIEYYATNRGGDITFHGPQQIVGYPILDLEKIKPDIVWYMRTLEEVIIKTLAEYGIVSERLPGSTGVWLDAAVPGRARKICAMGVRTSRWITMHGFALNVNTDLQYFDMIVPCGISDKAVTSMEKELGKKIPMEEVQEKILTHFAIEFGVEVMSEKVVVS